MKANELIIGYWVLINGTPRKIQAVDGVDDEIMADDELYTLAEDRYHSEDRVEGVPVTPKILEKNGFVYTKPQMPTESEDMVWQYRNDEKQTLIEIEEQMDEINLLNYYIGYFAGRANSCEIYFRHVHQLQHALSLCEIEKEIVL